MSPPSSVPLIQSVASLAPDYEAWLCDIWGVVHNGVRAFDGAVDACRRYREAGGIVVLLSNAPRPASAVQTQLDRLGVPREAYDEIVTSGDLTRNAIRSGLRQVVAAMPVYRTYIDEDRFTDQDSRNIAVAVAQAREAAPAVEPASSIEAQHSA